MRLTGAVACLALLAACAPTTQSTQASEAQPSARYTFWRPAPVQNAREPSEVIAATTAEDWRPIEPDNLLVMELQDGGRIFIELAPAFAPVHVANVRALARANWWRGATIYRVQDNYVVQWGNNEGGGPLPQGVVQRPPAEYERPLAGLAIRPLGFPDSYAPMVGHSNGWPIGYDPEAGEAWLTHCYASVGVGRDLAPDTGTGGELYAVIGHAPRALDRNIATIGRVVEGMPALTARPRGTGNLGFYQQDRGERPIPIARIRLAADMPAAERPQFEVMRTDTDTFAALVTGMANRGGTFFNRPAGGVDVCNARVPIRRRPAS